MSEQSAEIAPPLGTIADDLFAGAGGWDLAASALGIHARGVENMPQARATRDAAGLTTIHDDVWTYEPDGSASGLIASPPCQTFSAAGKGTGRAALEEIYRAVASGAYKSRTRLRGLGMYVGDDRTALVLTPLHFATTGGYEWLTWEQVPTVLPVWEACAAELRENGWHTWTGLLQAEMYGVPQTRKRAFLLASRSGPVAPPAPTHSRYYARDPERLDPGVQKWVSMAEALGWGLTKRPSPTVTGGGTETGGAEPIAKLARYTNRPDWLLRSPQSVAGGPRAERSGDQPSVTVTSNFDRARWCASPSGITGPCHRPLTYPAATVTGAGNISVHRSDECHTYAAQATETVRVTVSEAGVLQSFPHDYPWQGTLGKQFLQAGNAVPPGLAQHALAAVAEQRAEAVA